MKFQNFRKKKIENFQKILESDEKYFFQKFKSVRLESRNCAFYKMQHFFSCLAENRNVYPGTGLDLF